MSINEKINKRRKDRLDSLYKQYIDCCKTIKEKEYKQLEFEDEYKSATPERRREIIRMGPSDKEYNLRVYLFNTVCKELQKGELESFFLKRSR